MSDRTKLLILGLDGLPWTVLTPVMRRGLTPNLKKLIESGASGPLESTLPPQTASAWTTFMTGVHPMTHGVVNWHHYNPRTGKFSLHDARRFKDTNIYHWFSEAGLKVGVVCHPMVYPPFPVNGFLLTGFDSPGLDAEFCYPKELAPEILKLCPEHSKNLDTDEWNDELHPTDDAVFAENMAILGRKARRVAKLSIDLNRAHPADVLMVYFQETDLLLHAAWQWCDEKTWDSNPARRDAVFKFFQELDIACGEVLAATENRERLTLVLSDHGQRPDGSRVYLNSILMELGILAPASVLGRLQEAARRTMMLDSSIPRGLGVPLDWNRTLAFMPYQTCDGYIYINLKGREAHGSVDPKDYRAVRDKVIDALRKYSDPRTGKPMFDRVHAYHDPADPVASDLPDIYVVPPFACKFTRKVKRKRIIAPTTKTYAGMHDPIGMYAFQGPRVSPKTGVAAHIVDMAPTLMAAMGLPIPTYVEGRVVNECFDVSLSQQRQDRTWSSGAEQEVYSAEQAKAVEQRLADLGYLD